MLLSVLIPTLGSRRELFESLHAELTAQIRKASLENEVEILSECDNGEMPLGAKRNALVQRAAGEFVVFVDDDDGVSGDYVQRICDAIRHRPGIDCVGIRGVITFRGKQPGIFIHSLRYPDYVSRHGVYYRPPYHLNPVRRSIAALYPFREIRYSEDIEWALRLQRHGALRREEFIDAALYHYRSRRWWFYQWMLDRTETVRHLLGLRLVNRLRSGAERTRV